MSETLDVENSIELLILSNVYSAQKLRKNALNFISENMWLEERVGWLSYSYDRNYLIFNED